MRGAIPPLPQLRLHGVVLSLKKKAQDNFTLPVLTPDRAPHHSGGFAKKRSHHRFRVPLYRTLIMPPCLVLARHCLLSRLPGLVRPEPVCLSGLTWAAPS